MRLRNHTATLATLKQARIGEDMLERGWYIYYGDGTYYLNKGGTWTVGIEDATNLWPTSKAANGFLSEEVKRLAKEESK